MVLKRKLTFFLRIDVEKKIFSESLSTYTLPTIYPSTKSHLRISGIVSYRSLNKLNKKKVNTLG